MLSDPKLLVLLAVGCLTTMVGGIISPILPEMVHQLQLNPGAAGIFVSMHCLTIALFSPLLGILADRVGKLNVLLPSLVLYALFGTAGAFMHNLGPLLMTRGLLGAASGGIAASSLGLLGSLYEREARSQVLGYVTTTLTISSITFPLLGGWVGATHWQFTFYLYGLALPLAVIAARILPDKPSLKSRSVSVSVAFGSSGKLGHILQRPQVIQLLLTLGLASAIVYAVVIYAPLYLKITIGAGPTLNGILLASRAIGVAVISAFGARQLAKFLGLKRTIALGFGLMAVTLATIPLLYQLPWILLAAIVFGLGFGMITPNLYIALANLAPAEMQSSVLAAGNGAGFLGQFLSPIFLGPVLAFGGLRGAFYTAAGVAGLISCLILVQHRRVHRNQA